MAASTTVLYFLIPSQSILHRFHTVRDHSRKYIGGYSECIYIFQTKKNYNVDCVVVENNVVSW
jgi:hypothetical protein